MIFTKEQIDEIVSRLSIMGIKDTAMKRLNMLEHPLEGDETIVLVKGGENFRVTLEDIYEVFTEYIEKLENKEDFFNVSIYLGRLDPDYEGEAKPCTLEEAVAACPPYIRRAGENITFIDSTDSKWKTYQMTGDSNNEWEDLTKWKDYYAILQSQIYAIIFEKISVSIESSQEVIAVGDTMNITLTASSDIEAKAIFIKRGDIIIAEGSGNILETSLEVSESLATDVVFTAEFIFEFAEGNPKTIDLPIHFVNKMYIGSGSVYTDVATDTYAVSARVTPEGVYQVNTVDNQYVFFIVPATMVINKATLNGIIFPLEEASNITIEGVSYKSYRSSNTYNTGTYEIIIS